MRILITGTGRCGTQWVAAALSAAGVQCTHEVHWTRRRAGHGDWTAEASWPAAAYTPVAGAHVVHLVRHPLTVIRSRVAGGLFAARPRKGLRRLQAWTYRQAPAVAEGRTETQRAALHWVAWNHLVRGAAQRLRLEDITAADITRLARTVDPSARGLATLPGPVGARQVLGPEVTWSQVEHVPGLVELAEEYGYGPVV